MPTEQPNPTNQPNRYHTDERFAPIPLSLFEHKESTAWHIAAFGALRSFADFGSSKGAKVSDRSAAKRAGMSERKFRDCRSDLKTWGYVTWERFHGGVNHYVVRLTPAPGADVRPAPDAVSSAPPADNLEPVTESQKKNGALTRQDYIPFEEAFVDKFDGTVPFARIRKVMRSLIKRHGSQRVLIHWKTYLAQADQYVSPERFGQTFNHWGPKKEIGWAGF